MKHIMMLCSCMFLLLALPLSVLAQDGSATDPTGLVAYFTSLAALVPLVILITGSLKQLIKADGFLAQLLSWVISIGLCFAAWLLKVGLFAEVSSWWIVLIYGFAVGLAANGFFKIEFIQGLLKLLGLDKKAVPRSH